MLLILDKLCQFPFIGESATRTCECCDIGVMISGHLQLKIQVTCYDGYLVGLSPDLMVTWYGDQLVWSKLLITWTTWHDGTQHGDTQYGFSWYDCDLV